jgi:hypothetical protein
MEWILIDARLWKNMPACDLVLLGCGKTSKPILAQLAEEMGISSSKDDTLEDIAHRTIKAIENVSTPEPPARAILDNAKSYNSIKKWRPQVLQPVIARGRPWIHNCWLAPWMRTLRSK